MGIPRGNIPEGISCKKVPEARNSLAYLKQVYRTQNRARCPESGVQWETLKDSIWRVTSPASWLQFGEQIR